MHAALPGHVHGLNHADAHWLFKRSAVQEEAEQHGGLVLKDVEAEGDVRELEVEVVAGAVAEAVAEAVQVMRR